MTAASDGCKFQNEDQANGRKMGGKLLAAALTD